MDTNLLTISYPAELLLSLKESATQFEEEARVLLAVKLFELGKVSSGMAARVAGVSRMSFLLALKKYQLTPFGQEPKELAEDLDNA